MPPWRHILSDTPARMVVAPSQESSACCGRVSSNAYVVSGCMTSLSDLVCNNGVPARCKIGKACVAHRASYNPFIFELPTQRWTRKHWVFVFFVTILEVTEDHVVLSTEIVSHFRQKSQAVTSGWAGMTRYDAVRSLLRCAVGTLRRVEDAGEVIIPDITHQTPLARN
jgi:hypothetical protein